MKRISVFLVDDSALVRQLTADLLARQPDIEVTGTAPDPIAALPKLKAAPPDVLLLDVEMPRMGGLEFLDVLRQTPETSAIPVLMFSSLTGQGCDTTLQALERGAVDVVTKPKLDLKRGFDALLKDLIFKVRAAAQSKRAIPANDALAQRKRDPLTTVPLLNPFLREEPENPPAHVNLIAIGCSTGGTEALRRIFAGLRAGLPPIVIVQHTHERFIGPFAKRLDSIGPVRVKEADDGEKLEAGHAYLAKGASHLEVHLLRSQPIARISNSPAVNGHRPSVDVLFHSCAKALGSAAAGVLLTGMGVDGAKGLLALRQAGAQTIAQNEASCVVFGMPREAIALRAVVSVLPLESIAGQIHALTRGSATARL
jgi:two-component system, chemotaxis family, protein-glutamate methylesterase/glutaminase